MDGDVEDNHSSQKFNLEQHSPSLLSYRLEIGFPAVLHSKYQCCVVVVAYLTPTATECFVPMALLHRTGFPIGNFRYVVRAGCRGYRENFIRV